MVERLILGEMCNQCRVGCINILWVARQCHPSEGALALTEQRADKRRYKTREVESLRFTAFLCKFAEVVAVVECDCPTALHFEHEADMPGHAFQCLLLIRSGIRKAKRRGFG